MILYLTIIFCSLAIIDEINRHFRTEYSAEEIEELEALAKLKLLKKSTALKFLVNWVPATILSLSWFASVFILFFGTYYHIAIAIILVIINTVHAKNMKYWKENPWVDWLDSVVCIILFGISIAIYLVN